MAAATGAGTIHGLTIPKPRAKKPNESTIPRRAIQGYARGTGQFLIDPIAADRINDAYIATLGLQAVLDRAAKRVLSRLTKRAAAPGARISARAAIRAVLRTRGTRSEPLDEICHCARRALDANRDSGPAPTCRPSSSDLPMRD